MCLHHRGRCVDPCLLEATRSAKQNVSTILRSPDPKNETGGVIATPDLIRDWPGAPRPPMPAGAEALMGEKRSHKNRLEQDLIDRLFEASRTDEVKRTSLIVLLAGLFGLMFGATPIGYAAQYLGFSLLRFAAGVFTSDWTGGCAHWSPGAHCSGRSCRGPKETSTSKTSLSAGVARPTEPVRA